MGFFGFTPRTRERSAQPLHRHRLDIDNAVRVSARVLQLWAAQLAEDTAPAFSGGILDSWPAWAVDGFRICDNELEVVRAYVRAEEEAVTRGP